MNLNQDVIVGDKKTEEAEETLVPEAKQVEAAPFQGAGVGSSPIRDTNNNTWRDCAVKQIFIEGRPHSRLSFQT